MERHVATKNVDMMNVPLRETPSEVLGQISGTRRSG